MLKIKNLQVKYGVIEAVRNIDIDIKKGEIITIIGSNGAGKTSTLNAIMNLIKKSGEIKFLDTDISKFSTDKIVKRGISLVPEGRRVFINLTVDENLDLGAYNNEKNRAVLKEKMYKLFPRLVDKKTQLAGNLSGGEQQMLAIARALMNERKLLILDGTQGNSAIAQAKAFNEIIGIDGIIVTKLDGTAKGGALFSISNQLELPILYVGIGERETDLIPFNPDEFVDKILNEIYISI